MKNYLILFSLLISVFSFAQTKSKDAVSIKKVKLMEVKLLSDLVSDVVKDKAFLIEVSGKVGGKLLLAQCKSNVLNDEVKNILKNVDAGSKIYMDVKAEDKNTKVKSYVFLATE